MSEGRVHDVDVMIKNTSTLDWRLGISHTIQPRRILFSKTLRNHALSQHSQFDVSRILTGINFGSSSRSKVSCYQSSPSHQPEHQKSKSHDQLDHEPLWVSLLGGISLVVGFLIIWILA